MSTEPPKVTQDVLCTKNLSVIKLPLKAKPYVPKETVKSIATNNCLLNHYCGFKFKGSEKCPVVR